MALVLVSPTVLGSSERLTCDDALQAVATGMLIIGGPHGDSVAADVLTIQPSGSGSLYTMSSTQYAIWAFPAPYSCDTAESAMNGAL